MSYIEWESVSLDEAIASGKTFRRVEVYPYNWPRVPMRISWEIEVRRCSHNDGLVCGGREEHHPMICSCFSGPGIVDIKKKNRTYTGHEFK